LSEERTRSLAPEIKIAEQRLSVLELAKALGNVSAACKQRGMSRTQFYEYKRRFQIHGIEGLVDLPPVHHSHPNTTPPEVEQCILELSLEHPAWGCNRLSDSLKLEGIQISAITLQKILNRNEMGNRYDRWLKLEEQVSGQAIELNGEQVAFLEKHNPAFKERHVESSAPAQLLCQDTFFVGHIKGVGKVYLHTVIDAYCSLAFGFLHASKQPEAAAAVLHNDVLPFYREKGLPVQAVLTDNGREFCGKDSLPYELYLELNDIEHRCTQVRRPQTNGFVERFQRTVLDEFFCQAFRTTFYESVEALQADLDIWLVYYNTERPHQGYRNLGKRPIERLEQYVLEHSRPVLSPPATPEAQPGAQPQSRAFSEAALDGGEHRATIDPGDGGNGHGSTVGKVRKPREKSSESVRDDN
jgi:transposase InsO family protein